LQLQQQQQQQRSYTGALLQLGQSQQVTREQLQAISAMVAAKADENILHTPFNARELLWSAKNSKS
jgi:hypothetical protein